MKNEDQSIQEIDIETDNDVHYVELVIFLDKPDFLKLLPQLRKDYRIDYLLNQKE